MGKNVWTNVQKCNNVGPKMQQCRDCPLSFHGNRNQDTWKLSRESNACIKYSNMIKHAYITPHTLDNHNIWYIVQDTKNVLLANKYMAVKGLINVLDSKFRYTVTEISWSFVQVKSGEARLKILI